MKSFSLRKTFIYSLIILILLFVTAEGLAGLVIRFTTLRELPSHKSVDNPFHLFLGWMHRPNASIATTGECSSSPTHISTDGNGFSIVEGGSSESEFEILVTGGSTIFGVGSTSNQTTVPSHLAQIVKRKGKFKVTNLARRGYRSFQELNVLNEWLSTHSKVALVIAISGVNDAITTYDQPQNEYVLLPKSVFLRAVPLVRAAESGSFFLRNLDSYLRQHSQLFDLYYRIQERLASKGPAAPPPPNKEESDDLTKLRERHLSARVTTSAGHYAAMAALTAQHGARFILILQPTLTTKLNPQPRESDCAQRLFSGGDWSEYQDFERRYFSQFKKIKKHFKMVDLTKTFDREESDTFVDSCHYNDRGSLLLANAVSAAIEPILSAP